MGLLRLSSSPGPTAVTLEFDIEWRTAALTAILLPLLIALGFWQLDREAEKRALESRYASRSGLAPAPLFELPEAPAELAYRPVLLRGEFVRDEYLLLDNRLRDGRFGYEVIALFRLEDAPGYALVNRGWVAGDSARRSLPRVETPAPGAVIEGQVYLPPDAPFLLAEQELAVDGWPRVIQAVEMDKLAPALAERLGAPVYPHLIRLNPGEASALAADWPVVNLSPQTHRGYAVQWFTMAAVLVLFFVLRSSNLWSLLRHRSSRGR